SGGCGHGWLSNGASSAPRRDRLPECACGSRSRRRCALHKADIIRSWLVTIPARWLLPLPGGLTLFHEGGHAFLLILGGEEQVEGAPLEEDALGQRTLEGAVDGFLGHAQRHRRLLGDLGGESNAVVQERRGREDAADQPKL